MWGCLLEKGISRSGWTSKYEFALGPLCQESTDKPRKGKVPPRNIDKNLHKHKQKGHKTNISSIN